MSYRPPESVCKCCEDHLLPALSVDLIPELDDTIDLGSSSKAFKNAFFSGNIGIGTSAPGADIHIYNDTSFVDLIMEGSNGNVLRYKDLSAAVDEKWIEFRNVNGIGKYQSITDGASLNHLLVVMDLATGNVGIGLEPTANMLGLSIEAGCLTIKETATPTADADYGKVYCKNDNKLYFQDGAGVEHEIAFVEV
jgi:hypothetical protein